MGGSIYLVTLEGNTGSDFVYTGIVGTTGAVFFVGGAIVGALKKHAGRMIDEMQRANADPRWKNIEACIQYLAAVRKREEKASAESAK